MTRREHPLLAAVAADCRSKPEATEVRVWGETVFRVSGRVFALVGRPDRPAVTVKPSGDDVPRLLEDTHVRRARYVGRFGWLTVSVDDEESLQLALDLVECSYVLAAAGARRFRQG
jgi:predicted DNA-binding protein (MmcQ/YjbR family)